MIFYFAKIKAWKSLWTDQCCLPCHERWNKCTHSLIVVHGLVCNDVKHLCGFQEKDALEVTVRAFEDMEFHILELESGVEDEREGEDGERETIIEREITRVQHTCNASQVRGQTEQTAQFNYRQLNVIICDPGAQNQSFLWNWDLCIIWKLNK